MTSTQVSVAMATYNGARFLRAQLDSIAGQTLLPAELVVSDDGSTDETLEVIRSFAETAPFPVRILEKTERLGFADNFLFAAENCRHDYIAFCDQDDVWLDRKLEIGAARMRADDSLLSMHRLTLVDTALQPIGVWDQEIASDRAFDALELDPYITGWGNTMMFRRQLVHLLPRERRPLQPEGGARPLSHDTWLYVLAAALGRVSHIAAPLILYRQHGGNAMGVEAARRSVLHRMIEPAAIPVARYHEQHRFYADMAKLLDELAREGSAFDTSARVAAERFAERRDLVALRLAMYDGPTVRGRWGAYRAWWRLPRRAPLRRGAAAKALALGVSGLNKASRRVTTPHGKARNSPVKLPEQSWRGPDIPRIIHQTYLSRDLPPALQANVERLRAENPDWDYRFYDDGDCERYIERYFGPEMLRVYRRIDPRYGPARADLFRYLLMYREGGVYLDIKSRFARKIGDVLRGDEGFIASYWSNRGGDRHAGHGLHPELAASPRGELQQWHIISAPGHPFLRAVIEQVLANIDAYRPWRQGTGKWGVLRTTGPIPYTLAILGILDQHPHRLVDTEAELSLEYSVLPEERHTGLVKRHYSSLSVSVICMTGFNALLTKLFYLGRFTRRRT